MPLGRSGLVVISFDGDGPHDVDDVQRLIVEIGPYDMGSARDRMIRKPRISLTRAAFERVLSATFRDCAHPLARRVADVLPNRLIVPLF